MRIVIISLLLCVICNFSGNATVIYVSSSDGSDTNDGLTPETPLKSISKAIEIADTVLLKSSDVFYENVTLKRGVLSKYGGSQPPILSGYKRIVKPCWDKVGENLWRISLISDNYKGYDSQGSSLDNNIGCIHEYNKDLIHGRKLQYKSQLKENWDIWQTEHHRKNDIKANDFDFLYLYLSKDPNELKLEFSIGKAAAYVSNAEIKGLRFEGFGFGISAGTKSKIRECHIDAMGGMMQIGYDTYTCFGNGIEFWTDEKICDCIIEDCIISRCYDSGCTIQGRKVSPTNIRFRKNLIFDCCQGWEDFLSNDNSDVVFDKCVFEKNVVLNSGKTTGFGYSKPRFKYCHVLGNNYKGNKGMIIRNNTFVGGNYYCSGAYNGKYKSNKWQGNTCVIKRGDFLLGNYMGTKDVIRVPVNKGDFRTLKEATEDAISRYRELTGDETTRFVIKDSVAIDKQIKKLKRKYLKK